MLASVQEAWVYPQHSVVRKKETETRCEDSAPSLLQAQASKAGAAWTGTQEAPRCLGVSGWAMGKDGVPVRSLMVQKWLCEGEGFKCCVSVVVYGLQGMGIL